MTNSRQTATPAKQAAGKQTAARRPTKGEATRATGTAPAVPGRAAAATAEDRENIAIEVPFVGPVKLPRPQDTAYYAGIGLLAALELLEWPAAIALAIGHALIGQQQSRKLREFGEALEDA